IAPGTVVPDPVHHFDLFPTFAAAGGAALPTDRKLDGVDLLPFVRGEASGVPHRTLVWREGYQQTVLHDGWKLIRADQPDQPVEAGQKKWLFNLAADPTERENLAAQLPDKVAALEALLAAHNAEQAEPMWPSVVQNPQLIDKPGGVPYAQGDEYIYWPN
ncbi:MAG: sulfatase, partial [Halioglobus sp.]